VIMSAALTRAAMKMARNDTNTELDPSVPARRAGREGKVVMISKLVSGVLAVIALLALSAAAAQAGNGGSPTALTSFFVCKTINGDSAARSVDVQAFDPSGNNPGVGWGFTLRGVPIGNATLACAFAKLFRPTPPGQPIDPNNEIPPQTSNPGTFKDLKCYAISVPKSQVQTGSPPSYTVTDNLLPNGVDPDVTGSTLQYICAPATFTPNQ
jgi:hypothetical protein